MNIKFTKSFIFLLTAMFSMGLNAQNGLDFDGTDDRIDCGNDTSVQISGKAITLEAWIYPTAWKTNVYDGNVINKENNTNNYGYMLRVGAGGKLNFALGNGSWNELTSANTILTLNQWQHIAATYDGLKMRLYLNGVCTDSQSSTITLANTTTTNLAFGYNATYGRYYQGMLDEARIWNICRTKSELSSDMSREFCSPQKGLRAYYKFNQGKPGGSNTSVKALIDLSGYSNTGTLVGFTLTGSGSNWLRAQYFSRTVALTQDTANACDFYNSPSGKFKWLKTGIFYDTLQVAYGCDSIIVMDLTIRKSSTRFINAFACASYKSPSGLYTWTKSGTYKETLKNYVNCDSIVTVILKIGASKDSINPVACNTYKSPKGKTYTASGLYVDTLINYRGCDSVVKINLTILKSTSSTLNERVCKRYFSPSGKYTFTQQGTYLDTIKNEIGCDSIITINLSILTSSSVVNVKACKNYKSPSGKRTWTTSGTYKDTIVNTFGCDSAMTINLTILQTTTGSMKAFACRSYRGPGKNRLWKVSGIYKDTLVNYAGCDSFLTITLTIHTANTGVTQTTNTLTANSNTGTYLWLNCAQSMAPVPGATNKVFKPAVSGDYALEVTDSGCADTSSCYSVTVVGLNPISTIPGLTLGPNPNNGSFAIQLPYECRFTSVIIRDISGKTIYETTFENASVCNIEGSVISRSGIYFVEVKTDTFMHNQTISIRK